jgi:hypothetical protein
VSAARGRELRAAIALDGELAPGAAANVAACIAAGLGAAVPGLAGLPLLDADGFRSASSAHLPIPILRCASSGFAALLGRSDAPDGGAVVVFPGYAQRLHTAEEYWREHALRSLRTEGLLGLGLAGPAAWVRSLTGALPLFR